MHSITEVIQNILDKKHEENPIHVLINTEYLARHIGGYERDQLFIVTDEDNGFKQVTQTPLATAIILTLAHCMDQFAHYYPVYTYNPYLAIFVGFVEYVGTDDGQNIGTAYGLIESVRRHEALQIQDGVYKNDLEYNIFLDMADNIEYLIKLMRIELLEPWLKKLEYHAQRVSRQNFQNLQNYIDDLFTQHSRLLVLCIDFSYPMDNVTQTGDDIRAKYLTAKNDHERFLTNLESNSLGEHMLGYVWKLEYCPDKGWHYLMLFFFDGSRIHRDQTLEKLIGEYWSNITQGKGLYRNCNAFKRKYMTLGIGTINHYDRDLREGLLQTAQYLSKPDHMTKDLVPDNGKTFGIKIMLDPTYPTIGRPRSMSR